MSIDVDDFRTATDPDIKGRRWAAQAQYRDLRSLSHHNMMTRKKRRLGRIPGWSLQEFMSLFPRRRQLEFFATVQAVSDDEVRAFIHGALDLHEGQRHEAWMAATLSINRAIKAAAEPDVKLKKKSKPK